MSEKLSEHFTLEELCYSETAKARGINNTPSDFYKGILKHTCQYMLEKLRALLNEKYKMYKGRKVKYVMLNITSGYRCPKLNVAVGGQSSSQHVKGEAVDCEAVLVYSNGVKSTLPYNILYEDIKTWTKEGKLSVDQCIQEASYNKVTKTWAYWVHASHSSWGASKDRKQFLKYNNGTYVLDCNLK